jgi:hypothetical protein
VDETEPTKWPFDEQIYGDRKVHVSRDTIAYAAVLTNTGSEHWGTTANDRRRAEEGTKRSVEGEDALGKIV